MDDDPGQTVSKRKCMVVSTFFYVVAIPLSLNSIYKSVHFKRPKIGYKFI